MVRLRRGRKAAGDGAPDRDAIAARAGAPDSHEAGTGGPPASRSQDAAAIGRQPTATRRCPAGHWCGICGELVAAGTMEGMLKQTGWCHMAGCIVTVPPLPQAGAAGDSPRSAR